MEKKTKNETEETNTEEKDEVNEEEPEAEEIKAAEKDEEKPEAEEILRAELTKIRAEIVVALYDFAAIDGFSPTYNSAESLSRLQRMIQDAVKRASNLPEVKALITDFVRQKA